MQLYTWRGDNDDDIREHIVNEILEHIDKFIEDYKYVVTIEIDSYLWDLLISLGHDNFESEKWMYLSGFLARKATESFNGDIRLSLNHEMGDADRIVTLERKPGEKEQEVSGMTEYLLDNYLTE